MAFRPFWFDCNYATIASLAKALRAFKVLHLRNQQVLLLFLVILLQIILCGGKLLQTSLLSSAFFITCFVGEIGKKETLIIVLFL